MRRPPATSSRCDACWTRFTGRLRKDATSCCESAPGGPARRAGSHRAHSELPAVSASNPELFRDHARRPPHPAGNDRRQSYGGSISLGLVVRPGLQRLGALLAGGGVVAFHPVFGARLSRDDRDYWSADWCIILVCRADASERLNGSAVGDAAC